MTKKRRLFVLLAAAAVGVAGCLVWYFALNPGPGVTLANFDRVREGMSKEEVEAILGPPGVDQELRDRHQITYRLSIWEADDLRLTVHYDDGRASDALGEVGGKVVRQSFRPPESFLGKVRRLLHL
jgi:hypothetical protein